MFWKNWPYWVKGGIILGAIVFLLSFLYWSPINSFEEKYFGFILTVPFIISIFTGLGYRDIMTGRADLLANITFSLISFVLYFIIGAVIGIIYGKIKRKKENIINK